MKLWINKNFSVIEQSSYRQKNEQRRKISSYISD